MVRWRPSRLLIHGTARFSGRLTAVLITGLLVLAGCGAEEESDTNDSTIAVPTQAATGADVSSGCWTAEDRVTSAPSGNRPAPPLQWSKPPSMVIDASQTYTATITTNKGAFTVELYAGDAPQTVNSFVCLARAGYYEQTPFHRILDGFVIQGGDPTGTGAGSPGYEFADEPITRNYELGTLAMANSGPNTNGSQFFVIVGPDGQQLPKNYTIFGKVTEGMDVVNTIAKTPTEPNERGEMSVPTEPIVLQSVTIAES